MQNLIIRPILQNEIDLLRSISITTFCESFDEHNTPENMKYYIDNSLNIERLTFEFSNPYSEFYFAEYNNEIVGYLKLNTKTAQTESKLENSFEVERIYILNSHQRLKIGQELFDFSLQKAKNINCKYLWLGVWEHNYKAQRFYIKNRMEYFSSHPFMLGDDLQTDLLMRLEL
jgi:diamine N-acetyltransferase